jgi:hypothetical protein
VTKLRERISVNKRAREKCGLKRFHLRKLHELGVKEKYQVEISNAFEALENCDKSVDINNAWKSIRENIKTSAKENLGCYRLKHNKPWFDDMCSKLIDQRKQAKLQWLQNPNQINGDNLQNLRRKTNRTIRKKKREYLKDKIVELESNNRNKNIREWYRGINEFKKWYQPRISIIKMRMVIRSQIHRSFL